MDPVLTAVAALSLLMAIGMGFLVARLLREDRERSNARVAALSAMATDPAAGAIDPVARPIPAATILRGRHEDLEIRAGRERDPDLEIRPRPERGPQERVEVETWARPERAPQERVEGPDLFTEQHRSSPWGPRLAVIGALAAVIAAIGFAAVSLGSGRADGTPAANTTAQSAPAPEIHPLELLSLRYAQQAQNLTITGLVQNPRTAPPLSRVVATAFVFGPGGALLASGKAPLDFTTLAPGDESPFVIAVPVTGEVARYRIGFRSEDGRVIAHVDKRADAVVSASSK